MDKNKNKNYLKRETNRRLSKFSEYGILNVGWAASLVIFIILYIVLNGEGGISAGPGLYFALSYLVAALLGFVLSLKMRSDITKNNAVSKPVRMISALMIPFLFTGNIFIAIAGFSCIKKDRTLEYTLAFYALINNIMILLVSAINLFKPYVANMFLTGLYLLIGLSVLYTAITIIMPRFDTPEKYKKLMIPAVLMLASGLTGNLFAVAFGLVVISKIRNMNKNRTVEWIDILRRVFRNYMSVIGLFIVIFLLSLSICSYLTFDYGIAIDNDYNAILMLPSMQYPFGTDEYGRCVFTRIVFGARISLVIGFISTLIPLIIGGLLGAISGHFGAILDNTIMRVLDILYAVPSILLAVAIIASFGANTLNLILALSISMIPIYARTMRAQVMIVTSNEFVEAARACGQKEYKILLKHIIPNALSPMIVRATLSIGAAVLSTSSLSYLGLGVEPHIPEWGSILRGGSAYLETYPHLAIYSGIIIMLIVLAFNFFGDGLRDALDPKLK